MLMGWWYMVRLLRLVQHISLCCAAAARRRPPPPQRAGAVVMHCILHVDGDVDDNDDGRPCRVDNASAKFSYIGLGTRHAQWRGSARPSAMSECQLSP